MVAPVFLIVAIGYLLKKLGIINDNFVKVSSRIVFSASLPALIFTEVSTISFKDIFDIEQIIVVYIVTILSFAISWAFVPLSGMKDDKDKGAFIQGGFRGNYAIVGIAIIVSTLGDDALGKASIILAFTIPLYNVLSVIALAVYANKGANVDVKGMLLEILKNPLILAILAAIPFSYFHIQLPYIVDETINLLAALTLPLALIGIGGFLSLSDITKASLPAFISSGLKIILFPLLGTFAAYLLGYRGDDLGIMFIVFGCPTAIASFIMAEAMGSNSRLAGNIVLITTLGSAFTISLGLFILKQNGLI